MDTSADPNDDIVIKNVHVPHIENVRLQSSVLLAGCGRKWHRIINIAVKRAQSLSV